MKRLWPTLLLVLVCAGGFWFASEKGFLNSKTTDETAGKPFFTIKSDDLVGIAIHTKTDDIALTKKDKEWSMNKPDAYPLNTYGPDNWASAFALLTYESVVEEAPTDLAPYGLKEPEKTLTATLADGTVKKLAIGKPLPVSGTTYVQLEGDPKVYEVSDTSLSSLESSALSFVNTQAVDSVYNSVKTVKLTWKGQSWTLEKTEPAKMAYESKWKRDSKELTAEEGSAVLDKLTSLYADALMTPAAKADVSNPELTVTVTEEKDGKTTESAFHGKVKDDQVVFVKDGGSWAYSLKLTDVQALYDAGKNAGEAQQ
ncbi:DUF4340 domain-containing protein [Gorillibacterium timonense]|uniref:DUF4340 domain-containing protein n=1 Tax=Gorillibacterium timonense TaxID=1689269 RepID=UPI00071D9410|nr:DUF4340 domain-containing protein [Gorillibacterium timonense]